MLATPLGRFCARPLQKAWTLSRSSAQLWFCLSVAAISAAIADPLVEWSSNSGLFGPGNFTDHSSADVVPALLAGGILLLAHLIARVRRALLPVQDRPSPGRSRDAFRGGMLRLLPLVFAIQIATLFCMETSEQIVVIGRPLLGAVWLGGPLWISLAVHAVVCVAIAYLTSKLMAVFARTAVRAVRMIFAVAVRAIHGVAPIDLGHSVACLGAVSVYVLGSAGERAPPLLTA
jgi:hypothetical protein